MIEANGISKEDGLNHSFELKNGDWKSLLHFFSKFISGASISPRSLRKTILPIFHAAASSSVLPIILTLLVLSLLTVLFRMKRIELDYKFYEVGQQIEQAQFENKELRAQKANLLSIKNLSQLAKKFELERPQEKQIILVP